MTKTQNKTKQKKECYRHTRKFSLNMTHEADFLDFFLSLLHVFHCLNTYTLPMHLLLKINIPQLL